MDMAKNPMKVKTPTPGTDGNTDDDMSGRPLHRPPMNVPIWTIIGVVAIASSVLFFGSSYSLFLAQTVLIAGIVSMALTLLSGTAGQFSLGSAALMGLGAYASAGAAVQFGLPPTITIFVALFSGAAFGFITGLPALRLKGIYLVMSTLAGHFIVLFLLQKYQIAFFGVVGIRAERPQLISGDSALFVTIVISLIISLLILYSVQSKRHGRAMKAVRDRDLVAEASGVAIGQVKIFAFILTSVIIAGAGVLQSYSTGFVAVDQYGLDLAVSHVAMIIIGGLGSLPGAIAGATVVTLLPVVVDELAPVLASVPVLGAWLVTYEAEVVRMLYGVLIVVFIVAQPGGIAALLRNSWINRSLSARRSRPSA